MPKVHVMTRREIAKLAVVGSSIEILDWWLYDTLNFTSGTTQLTFFQQAGGAAGITRETTNMDIPSQLPAGHRYVSQKIVLSLFPVGAATALATLTDLRNIVNAGRAQFFIGTRDYMDVPINNLIGGNLQGFVGAGGTNILHYEQARTVVNGEMEYAPVIPSNYNFGVRLSWNTGPVVAANVGLKLQIVGKLLRPVQG